jgi:acyl carrier protein
MLPTTLYKNITELFSARLGLDIPSTDTDLFESGVVDSVSFVELLLQIETTFGIPMSLGDIEFENFRTVEKIADFIASRRRTEVIAAGA